ncbi:MAG: efflux RND transporter periplasmic adaptor subunit [Verrucomicrobia bacterium]|nr:efflux RND transporter periplasmic adaptor subunit [Verrucomicrobiota bacterium]
MKSCTRFIEVKAAGALLFGIATLSSAAAPLDVKVARPARGEIIRYVTLPGSLRANQQATLYAKVPGYLKSIAVDRGDKVKAGQLLAEIEVPELLADFSKSRSVVARVEAELARAKAVQARAKAEAEVAALDFQRLGKAKKTSPDLVVAQQVDEARARSEVAKAAQNQAKAETDLAAASLAEAMAGVERIEILLNFAKVTAPFAGVVTARHVDVGAFIPAATGGSAAQTAALVTMMDFSTVRAQVAVPELESPLVREGQPVKVAVEGLPGKNFEGKVSRHSFALDDASKTMLVEADLPNPQLELRPGMYATVKVGVEKHTDALLIPAEALVMEKVNAFAFIAAGGKAKKTAIKIGFNDGAKVEVLGGLTGGEAVILVGKLALADGAAVNATEAK